MWEKAMKLPEDVVNDLSDLEIRRFHEESPGFTPFQTGEMIEVYRRTRGCRPHVFGSLGPGGALAGLMVSVVFQDAPAIAHASVRGGPVCHTGFQTTLPSLLESHERRLARTTLYTRIYPYEASDTIHSVAPGLGFERTPWLNYLVGIGDLESSWRALTRERRKGIRKADEAGLTVRDAHSDSDIELMYRMLRQTAGRHRIPMQHRSLFLAVREILAKSGKARLVFAFADGEAVACRVVLAWGDRLYDWYAGSHRRGYLIHANEWLVWRLMEWGHEKGLQVLDFGGAGDPAHAYGPREFKRRFNGTEIELGRYTRRHYPRLVRVAEAVRMVCAGGTGE